MLEGSKSNTGAGAFNINAIMQKYDDVSRKDFDEMSIWSELNTVLYNNRNSLSDELVFEKAAFDFAENLNSFDGDLNIFFRPKYLLNGGGENVVANILIGNITEAMAEYYERRLNKCKHPILVARYSIILILYKQLVIGKPINIKHLKSYVNSIIKIVTGGYSKSVVVNLKKLNNALIMCIKFRSREMLQICKEALINYEFTSAEDSEPGLWGYTFNLLSNPNLYDEVETELVVSNMEERFERLVDDKVENFSDNLHGAERAVNYLTTYYRKVKQKKKRDVVINVYAEFVRKCILNFDVFSSLDELDKLHKLCKENGMRKLATELLVEIKELSIKQIPLLQKISGEQKIDKEKLEQIIIEFSKGSVQQIIDDLIKIFVLPYDYLLKRLYEEKEQYFHKKFFGNSILDERGRVESKMEPLSEENEESHVIFEMGKIMHISSIYLHVAFVGAIQFGGLTEERITSFLKNSVAFKEARMEIVKRGVAAYYKRDFVTMLHLIVPQLEESIRDILERHGEPVIRLNNGVQDLLTFGTLLSNKKLLEIFPKDFVVYLKALLTDRNGWNLRNKVCHGVLDFNQFTQTFADRVLHCLLCFGLIKPNDKE